MRAETAAIEAEIAAAGETRDGWAHDRLTRYRLAREFDRSARNEGLGGGRRRPTADEAYERGRAEAFRIAANMCRDDGVRVLGAGG